MSVNVKTEKSLFTNNYFEHLFKMDKTGVHSGLILSKNGKVHQVFFKGYRNNKYVTYKNKKTGKRQTKKLLDGSTYLNNCNRPYLNYFSSLNTFYRFKRGKKYVVGLNANYLDLDIKKCCGLSPVEFLKFSPIHKIIEEVWLHAKIAVPFPTYIVISGHGLHLIWAYPKQYYLGKKYMRTDWLRVQHWLAHYINLGCDFTCGIFPVDDKVTKDIARVLRMPNTINNKRDKLPVPCFQTDYVGRTYSLFYLYSLVEDDYKRHSSQYNKSVLGKVDTKTKKHKKCTPQQAKYWVLCRLHNDLNRIINKRKHPKKSKSKHTTHFKRINFMIGRGANSKIQAMNGFISHIESKNFDVYRKRDWSMYYYVDLLIEKEPHITQKQLLSRFSWFVHKILKPNANEQIPRNDVIKIFNEIKNHHNPKHHDPWEYKVDYDEICKTMGWSRLWMTRKQRIVKNKKIKAERDKKILKLHQMDLSNRKIGKTLSIDHKTVGNVLENRWGISTPIYLEQ